MRMRLDDRAINQQIASLRLFECSPQDFPTTGDSPATIPTIDAIPLAEPPRQVSPRRPSAPHPDPFDKATVIPPLGASRGQPSNSTLQLTPTLLADHHSPCHTAGIWMHTERMSSQCPHALAAVGFERAFRSEAPWGGVVLFGLGGTFPRGSTLGIDEALKQRDQAQAVDDGMTFEHAIEFGVQTVEVRSV